MNRFLTLSIRFLDDRYHGQTDSGERPEWPPSPFRLFQALIAGNARGRDIPQQVRDGLCWLEALDPPVVMAPDVRFGRPLLTYVLNNVVQHTASSRTPKSIRPVLLNGDRVVQYSWRFDGNDSQSHINAESMTQAARRIRCLGWGIDLAVGSGVISDSPPEILGGRVRYTPSNTTTGSGIDLRVPRCGSLYSLESGYRDFMARYETPGVTRLESAPAAYEPRLYVAGACRPNVSFRLTNSDGDGISAPPQMIKSLVGRVRALATTPRVIDLIGQDVVDRHVLGHPRSEPNRIAILPLPTIRTGHTDGRIRRIMLAQDSDSDGVLCESLGQLFDNQQLVPLPNDSRLADVVIERTNNGDAVVRSYTAISKVWATVTPVLLPGHDDRRFHRGDHMKRIVRATQLIAKALRQAGITNAATIELSKTPFFAGSRPAREYEPRAKLTHYPRWHTRIEFDQPVTGPLAIGAGRFCGFGLFAAVDE